MTRPALLSRATQLAKRAALKAIAIGTAIRAVPLQIDEPRQTNIARRICIRNPKSIIFVTSLLRQREIKMATALRSEGWSVVLVYYKSTPFAPERHFDHAIRATGFVQIHRMVKRIAPPVCHVFSGAVDDMVLTFCRDKPCPVVIDLNDVFCPSMFDYQHERFAPTREVLALADGFTSRDLQALYARRYDGFELPAQTILFPEYSWIDGLSLPGAVTRKDPDEVHVVSVGTFTLETHDMFDSAHLRIAEMLTEQKIHFHIYPHWAYRKGFAGSVNRKFEHDFRDFIALAARTPYLHLHDSLPAEELARVLPQYDFGIVSGACEPLGQRVRMLRQDYIAACYSGRISDYLDARLPVLINREVEFNARILRHYGVRVELEGLLKPDFREKLLAMKRDPDLKERSERAARRMSLMAQSKRLAAFHERVIAGGDRFPYAPAKDFV